MRGIWISSRVCIGGNVGWGVSPHCFAWSFAGMFCKLSASLLLCYRPVFVSCRWQAEGRPNQSPMVSFYRASGKCGACEFVCKQTYKWAGTCTWACILKVSGECVAPNFSQPLKHCLVLSSHCFLSFF